MGSGLKCEVTEASLGFDGASMLPSLHTSDLTPCPKRKPHGIRTRVAFFTSISVASAAVVAACFVGLAIGDEDADIAEGGAGDEAVADGERECVGAEEAGVGGVVHLGARQVIGNRGDQNVGAADVSACRRAHLESAGRSGEGFVHAALHGEEAEAALSRGAKLAKYAE